MAMNNPLSTLPSDIAALLSRRGPVKTNEARTFERLGAGEVTLGSFETTIEPWLSFATGRRSWVSSHRGRVQAGVSARRRGGRRAWEIDVLTDSTPDISCLPRLLDDGSEECGRAGAEKIFVRVPSHSPLLSTLIAAGFTPYANEVLYERALPFLAAVEAGDAHVRPMTQQDLYPAFRLYNACYPESRRRLEGATFDEWQASRETRWLKGGTRAVLESEGRLLAIVRAAPQPQGLLMDLLVADPGRDLVAGILSAATCESAGAGRLFCLVAEEGALASTLQSLGFSPHSNYVSLVCRTTQVVRLGHRVGQLPRTAVVT